MKRPWIAHFKMATTIVLVAAALLILTAGAAGASISTTDSGQRYQTTGEIAATDPPPTYRAETSRRPGALPVAGGAPIRQRVPSLLAMVAEGSGGRSEAA